ncbi:Enhancer of split mgamma protein [Pseudolycoriella hygida]|uniref:Enhancer of split mgamma protein n=1 Tax=Pseudolycoriella hygida TaxID=35572 RepID=A0A9Q0NGZ3_9DIPT|nr:Enhancer of split mgamma protein [Pseudolycoriella hygida]
MRIVREDVFNKQNELQQDKTNKNWTHLFRKPYKPKLPRKIVSSAKVNLNKYWHKFEDFFAADGKTNAFEDSTTYSLLPLVHKKQKSSTLPSKYGSTGLLERNNVHDEINSLMSKNFTAEKNYTLSSMYKHFNDESLYHGVNLNLPRQRCSCTNLQSKVWKHPFGQRNIQLSFGDKDNLENDAMVTSLRKVMKPMLERKRRARINRCLDELKELITGSLKTEVENVSKLEKADILELTVRHLHNIRRQNEMCISDKTFAERFESGFRHCATEVTNFLDSTDEHTTQLSTPSKQMKKAAYNISPPPNPRNITWRQERTINGQQNPMQYHETTQPLSPYIDVDGISVWRPW